MFKRMLKPIACFCFLLLCARLGLAANVNDIGKPVMIGRQIEVLQSDRELAFTQVKDAPGFKKYTEDVPNLGFSKVSVWLRFTASNTSKNPILLLDVAYPILDEVELFSPDEHNQYTSNLMGEIKPFDARKYNHPDYIFNLNIPQNTSRVYYLRIKSAEQLIIPISISPSASLWQNLSEENLLSGIYIGAVFIMFLYNLFVFFSVKDRSYLYYVVYVACVGFTQIGIKGYPFQYLWNNSPSFELKSINIFACLAPIAALFFTKAFLSTKLRAPRFDIVLNVIVLLLTIALVITLSGNIQLGFQLMQVTTTLFVFSLIIVSAIVLNGGYRPALFILVSWSLLLIGAIIFTLKDNGVLPYNIFTSYSMAIGTTIEMALLSFGLADKINVFKKEKELSQAEALRIATENERIIREQNVVLEQRVEERTYKLQESNQELNKTLIDLKEAQMLLVESEKMASLGQLTAGIAHEINNPINFVTSNINPLRRDIDLMIDAFTVIENVGVSDASPADKRKRIDEYKEELDFDYLTMEIRHLIKGINEGANRTAEIVKGLKIFSRLDEDDLKKANINEGLESTMVIANNLLNSKITVIKEYGDLPLVECYPGKLNQVFLNVLANAIYAIKKRFGDSAGGQITITTIAAAPGVLIKIKDNGTGMDEQTQKKIFEPFFTTKDVGEGTGLGMSIAYNTVKKHNGQITAYTEVGAGTEIVIALPLIFTATAT